MQTENEDSESGNGTGSAVSPLLDKQLHYKDIQMGERIGTLYYVSPLPFLLWFVCIYFCPGRGSFGEVYSATWFQTRVAVKKLPLEVLFYLSL
jgi:hypothetical protein